MARPPAHDPARLTLQLQAYGAATSQELSSALRISVPTLTRMIGRLGPAIETIGAARSTRYALRRNVAQLGNEWPVYRITPEGRPQLLGMLRSLVRGFRFVPQGPAPGWMRPDYKDGLFDGLPFFLQDVRPQGFIGRAIARRFSQMHRVPVDPREWKDDDSLLYLLTEGDDLPGDILLGDQSLAQFSRAVNQVAETAIDRDARASEYTKRVEAIQRGEIVGSSAGGEQPKFIAVIRSEQQFAHVIVKFSPQEDSGMARRWADLLLCEHLAAEVIRESGRTSAKTSVIDVGGRRFLEVERFDRTPEFGRRGVLTLGTLEDTFSKQSPKDWSEAAGYLQSAKLIESQEAAALRWFWAFGELIANSDMHRSNASFWMRDGPPYEITPFYDMLPMYYAPNLGEVMLRPFEPKPPTAAVMPVWNSAAQAAMVFWERVAQEARVSNELRSAAESNRRKVEQLRNRFGV